MTEAQLQAAVIELARLLGWRVAHFRAAWTGKGYRTPVEADGAGFPDLVLARQGRLLFVELKSARGKVGPDQLAWLQVLGSSGAGVTVWTPAEWSDGTVELVLRNLDRVPAGE